MAKIQPQSVGLAPELPRHIGIIMDGNGRYATRRGLPRKLGHRAGMERLRGLIRFSSDIGIEVLSLYAFSTENWKRPKEEVDALMRLFYDYLDEADRFTGKKARIMFLGSKEPFPEKLRERMIKLEQNSVGYDSMTIMFAMNYGGRDDIVYAARRLAEAAADVDIKPSDIDEKLFSGMLYTGSAPDADLIIRTSGELRLSNFLLWQAAYAELYSTDVLWPDFNEKELDKALEAYASRSRRFGGV